ncbi:MAG TPA: hypothetical protein VND20_05605, partial [Candidatus Binataceae bacterium]|nr:hypothetical protein [Candidatus Binataceae bacterium]
MPPQAYFVGEPMPAMAQSATRGNGPWSDSGLLEHPASASDASAAVQILIRNERLLSLGFMQFT